MMEAIAGMDADVAKLPQWVQIWINILVPVLLIGTVVLFFNAATRKLAVVCLVLLVLGGATVIFLHSQMGMVRLLGLGHIIFWLPLLIIMVKRLRTHSLTGVFRFAMIVIAVTLTATLAFDIVDVVRWIIGERGPIV